MPVTQASGFALGEEILSNDAPSPSAYNDSISVAFYTLSLKIAISAMPPSKVPET